MTKRERNFLYKEAFYVITNFNLYRCRQMCTSLSVAMYGHMHNHQKVTIKSFPELFLFKPDFTIFGDWFDYTDTETRLNILAFCIAMTEN